MSLMCPFKIEADDVAAVSGAFGVLAEYAKARIKHLSEAGILSEEQTKEYEAAVAVWEQWDREYLSQTVGG